MAPALTYGRLSLGDVTPNNINQLRKLNSVLFPMGYSDKFYQDVLASGELAKLGYFNDVCVAAVCCKKETVKGSDRANMYIMTLGVLAPYRRVGFGSLLLKHVISQCEQDPSIDDLYLHVQAGNDDALQFYSKFGFTVRETIPDYYKKIEPHEALVVLKSIRGGAAAAIN